MVHSGVRLQQVSPIVSGQELFIPVALSGDVVDHRIEHQIVALSESLHILPGAQSRVHPPIVDHAKAVV